MALRLEDKKAIVADVNEAAGSAISAVLADYRGLDVAAMTELRARAREADVYLKVVQNTLAKRALAGTHLACLEAVFVGPSMLALSTEEPSAAARLIRDFATRHPDLEVKALAISGELLGPERLEAVATLPTRDEALSMLMATMQAPITKMAQTVNEIPGTLVRTVEAVRQQKESEAA